MRRYIQILLANLLMTSAYAFITVPSEIINGGLTSLSMTLSRLLPLPVYGWLAILMLAILSACYFVLGKDYFFGSLFSCVIFLALFSSFSLLNWAPKLPISVALVLSGLMIGVGTGLCVRANATTIGMDTLALFVHRGVPKISVPVAMYGFNVLVLLLGMAVYGLQALLLGLCFSAVQALAMWQTLRLKSRLVPDFRSLEQQSSRRLATKRKEIPIQYTTVLFDLDGTLTDPGLGITNSILYAMQQEKMPLPPRQELYQFIGPPLLEAFQSVFGVSEPQALRMLTNFRIYFEKQGIYENTKYEGIDAMLQRLRDAGCRLAVATSKPEHFAAMVLDHFGLTQYFELIAGANLDETRSAKHAVIAYALDRLGEPDRATTIMVGDRSHDIVGGKRNDLATLGVLYGFGNQAEMEGAGADMIASTVDQVADLLLTTQKGK